MTVILPLISSDTPLLIGVKINMPFTLAISVLGSESATVLDKCFLVFQPHISPRVLPGFSVPLGHISLA
jgi:hypothetical protein